ncbi:MAG: HAD hydrolase family protein [Saprospiraceae bacterium]|nr:HAD hydrolase family protein [Saprospiraceae bacterium]
MERQQFMRDKSYYELLPTIKAIVLDVDGVLTDNKILVTEDGQFLRSMNVRDGYAIKKAIQNGLKIAVITGGRSDGVLKRLGILNVKDVHMGVEDKLPVLISQLAEWNISAQETAYMGDDELDIACLQLVGLAVCPEDAMAAAINHALHVSKYKGGEGCVRELIENILRAKNLW